MGARSVHAAVRDENDGNTVDECVRLHNVLPCASSYYVPDGQDTNNGHTLF